MNDNIIYINIYIFIHVREGVQHIIADRISKDKDTIEFLIRDACGNAHIMIEAQQSNAAKKDEQGKDASNRFVFE